MDGKLWVRDGDAGSYTRLDSLHDLADFLRQLEVTEYDVRTGGIEAPGFRGENYISVYWGDAAANLVRDLTGPQHEVVREFLFTR